MNGKNTNRNAWALTLSLCLGVIFAQATGYAADEREVAVGQDAGKPGQPKPCTITLYKKASNMGTGFSFSSAWSGLQGITLDNGQSKAVTVPCGPIFNVFETPKPGWTLSNIACTLTGNGNIHIIGASATGATDGFEPGDNEVNFDSLGPGASLQCTFINTAPPPCTITIYKKATKNGKGFTFSSAWSGLQGITLSNGQSISKPVPCGPIFNVFETPKPGWTLSNIACTLNGTGNIHIIGATTSPTNGFEFGDNEVNFDSLGPGASLQCTFTNK